MSDMIEWKRFVGLLRESADVVDETSSTLDATEERMTRLAVVGPLLREAATRIEKAAQLTEEHVVVLRFSKRILKILNGKS